MHPRLLHMQADLERMRLRVALLNKSCRLLTETDLACFDPKRAGRPRHSILGPIFHCQSFQPLKMTVVQRGQNQSVSLGGGRDQEVKI